MGNSDGTLHGRNYFHAKKNHGVFESAEKIQKHIKKEDIADKYAKDPTSAIQGSSWIETEQPSSAQPKLSSIKKKKGKTSDKNKNLSQKRHKDVQSVGDEYEGHKVNTRVVYFDKDFLHGTLRFLGYLSKYDDRVFAVAEMVRFQFKYYCSLILSYIFQPMF